MISALTTLIVLLVINHYMVYVPSTTAVFLENLIENTRKRYSVEYIKLRSSEDSDAVLREHLNHIASIPSEMNLYDYKDFKNGLCKAIAKSEQEYKAELCFIHDLMLEEYVNLKPKQLIKHTNISINSFYDIVKIILH